MFDINELSKQFRFDNNKKDRKMEHIIKKALINSTLVIIGVVLFNVFLIYGIDAEVARQDREMGRKPTNCIFESNCHS